MRKMRVFQSDSYISIDFDSGVSEHIRIKDYDKKNKYAMTIKDSEGNIKEIEINNLKNQIPKNITVVAVSKRKSNKEILEVYNTNHKDFGENRVQELIIKNNDLPKDIRWHMIGKLQRNKVKFIAPFIHLIHSVDSYKLLLEIEKQAKKNQRVINILLQIKISNDESKSGLSFNETQNILNNHEQVNIKIIGLMGMGSLDMNKNESEFIEISNFYQKSKDRFNFKHLSLGMSGDYKLAIENNSNMIRVGSLIFGGRN